MAMEGSGRVTNIPRINTPVSSFVLGQPCDYVSRVKERIVGQSVGLLGCGPPVQTTCSTIGSGSRVLSLW